MFRATPFNRDTAAIRAKKIEWLLENADPFRMCLGEVRKLSAKEKQYVLDYVLSLEKGKYSSVCTDLPYTFTYGVAYAETLISEANHNTDGLTLKASL